MDQDLFILVSIMTVGKEEIVMIIVAFIKIWNKIGILSLWWCFLAVCVCVLLRMLCGVSVDSLDWRYGCGSRLITGLLYMVLALVWYGTMEALGSLATMILGIMVQICLRSRRWGSSLSQVRGLYIVLCTLCVLYELTNGMFMVGLVASLNALKWSYGSNGMFYQNSWFAKRLINLAHLYELLVFLRENCNGLNIYNMYLVLMGLWNDGKESSAIWKDGFRWCDHDPDGSSDTLNGFEYGIYGFQAPGIIRLLSIIKLQSSRSKGQNQSLYI